MAKAKEPESTRKQAGDIPDPRHENAGYRGGVVRTMGETTPSLSPLVTTMDRALGGMGRVNPNDPNEKPAAHKIIRRM